jgi:hypothetical protein
MNDIKNIQNRLKEGKAITNYDVNEIKYMMRPIGNAIYEQSKDIDKDKNKDIDKNKNKKKWDDILICDICNKNYTRSNKSQHNKSVIHIEYSKINKKLRDILINK